MSRARVRVPSRPRPRLGRVPPRPRPPRPRLVLLAWAISKRSSMPRPNCCRDPPAEAAVSPPLSVSDRFSVPVSLAPEPSSPVLSVAVPSSSGVSALCTGSSSSPVGTAPAPLSVPAPRGVAAAGAARNETREPLRRWRGVPSAAATCSPETTALVAPIVRGRGGSGPHLLRRWFRSSYSVHRSRRWANPAAAQAHIVAPSFIGCLRVARPAVH